MTDGVKTVLYPAKDLDAAKAVFAALLGAPIADAPYYVGWHVAGQDIGLVPTAEETIAYFGVPDIAAAIKTLTDAGATIAEDAKAVGGGRQVATVTAPGGIVIGLVHDAAAGS
jgi:predicted enzyme related to lactoylglutathione lyase